MSEQEQHDTSNGVPNEPNDQHHAAPTANAMQSIRMPHRTM